MSISRQTRLNGHAWRFTWNLGEVVIEIWAGDEWQLAKAGYITPAVRQYADTFKREAEAELREPK